MKITLKTLLATAAIALPFSAIAESSDHHMDCMKMHKEMKEGGHHKDCMKMPDKMMKDSKSMEKKQHQDDIMGKGVVRSIDMDARKINLTHEPIPALKWPEMTMDLPVTKDVDLSSVKPDDEITFHIVLGEDKVYRITGITSGTTEHNHTH